MSTIKGFARTAAMAVGAWATVAVPAFAQEGAAVAPMTLSVENARSVPVVVYLERGQFDTRIGTVPAHERKDLALPNQFLDGERISFFVHPEGGPDLATPDKYVVGRDRAISLYVPTSDNGFVPPPPPEMIANPGMAGATLTVENPSGQAVVAFVERGEFDTRIGTVAAGESKTFALPPAETDGEASIDIFLHVEGGRDLASTSFQVAPDAHLLVKVPT